MAEADWTNIVGGLSAGGGSPAVSFGPTIAIAPPLGGASFIYAINSLQVTNGVAGKFVNQTGFTPTAANKGGRVNGAMQRGISSGATGFSAFFYGAAGGNSATDNAYMLGLSNADPAHIR